MRLFETRNSPSIPSTSHPSITAIFHPRKRTPTHTHENASLCSIHRRCHSPPTDHPHADDPAAPSTSRVRPVAILSPPAPPHFRYRQPESPLQKQGPRRGRRRPWQPPPPVPCGDGGGRSRRGRRRHRRCIESPAADNSLRGDCGSEQGRFGHEEVSCKRAAISIPAQFIF